MLNVIILAGNAVADPVTRTTQTGKNISTVRLAVNNPLNDEEVLYIDVDTWDKQSEFVSKYVKKGNSLSVVGRLKSREFTGNDGVKRTAFSVVCERVNFIGSKKKSDNVVDSDESPLDKEIVQPTNIAAKAAAAMAKLKATANDGEF
jgi:single-strand DNA-binding protein